MRTAKGDVNGTVRVSVAPGFVPVLVRGMLPALRDAHPWLRVELDGGFQRVDLAQHEHVLYTEAMHRVPPLRSMEAYRGTARELSRVDNLEIACRTIAAGAGIAVLLCFITDPVPGLGRVFPDRERSTPAGSCTTKARATPLACGWWPMR